MKSEVKIFKGKVKRIIIQEFNVEVLAATQAEAESKACAPGQHSVASTGNESVSYELISLTEAPKPEGLG